MKAIITGGAGFIGSHLVDRLLQEGHSVTVVDNMSCGSVDNLAQHSGDPRLVVHQADVKDGDALTQIFSGHDVVFHLAAQANIRKSLIDHRSDLDNNLIGTLNVMDAMIKNGIRDLVFASTSAVYGEATLRPTPETYFPYQTSLYGASKLACEAYAEAYTEFAPLKFWAFRFANVIGERCRRGVIWDFTHKLKNNPHELEILGDGKQSKEYFHVKDCIEGILIGYRNSHAKTNIFNLGLEEQTVVDNVADLIMDEMGLDKAKVTRKYTGGSRGWIGDNPLVVLSIEKIKQFGWRQSVSSYDAIKQTARWTLQHL
jgi:UDP-glucose 4-epimerase